MRTTVDLADDVLAAVRRLRQEQGLGLSEAVNRLVRAGLQDSGEREPYELTPVSLGLRVDIADSDFARFPGLTWVNPLLSRLS